MDRRSFIGSASLAAASIVALPVATMAAPATNRAEWDAAMAVWLRTKANYEWFKGTVYAPARARAKTRGGRVSTETEAAMDLAQRKFNDAEAALMTMQAPDRAALRWKLDIALEDCNGELNPWTTEYLAQTVCDYRRLLANA